MTGIKETVEAQNTEAENTNTNTETNTETGIQGNIDTDVELPNRGNRNTGQDLDTRLNRLAGIADETVAAGKGKQVSQEQTIDPKTGKPIIKEGEQQPQPQQQQSVPGRARFSPTVPPRAYGKAYRWDTQGNVVSSTTGEIVAAIGAERKAFERMLPLINTANGEADKYKSMLEAATGANTIAANLKLAPEEYAIGARIMAAFKSDPKKAIAFLVKEAQDNGVDVSDLGIQGGGVTRKDMEDTMRSIVSEMLKPFSFITEEREAATRDVELRSEADTVIYEFLQQHPDAQVHTDAIAKIMNANPGQVPMSEAYYILKSHALENGFDWTKDLVPQAQAHVAKLKGNSGTPTNNANQPANNPQRRLPPMGGRPNNGNIIERNSNSLSGESSTGDIVKDAMREAGMDISNV